MEEFDKSSLYYVDSTPEGTRYSLYDTASWKNGLAFKNIDFSESGLPVIKIAELNNGISSSTAYTDKTYSQDVFLTKGDYVFSWSGNPETSIDIYKYNLPDGWLNQHIFKVTPKTEIIDKGFFFYLMKFLKPYFKKIATNKQTTGLGHVTISDLQRMSVALPPLPTQQKIAAILSSLDDKIELNNKINTNLEQQAQALFKNWFVDFEPFGGKMPEGWKVGKLGDFVEIKRGGSPRPIQKFLSNEGYRWLKISDVTSLSAPFVLNIAEHIKEEGLSKTVFLKAGSLVLSNSATPGITKILDLDTCIHDGWLYFPKSQLSNEYLYLLFKEIRPQLVNLGNGSIFTNLKTDILKNFEISLPSRETLSKFQSIIKPIFEKMLVTQREIKQLETLRDTLLPKLMNGELSI